VNLLLNGKVASVELLHHTWVVGSNLSPETGYYGIHILPQSPKGNSRIMPQIKM